MYRSVGGGPQLSGFFSVHGGEGGSVLVSMDERKDIGAGMVDWVLRFREDCCRREMCEAIEI